jgi:hypothetical protein
MKNFTCVITETSEWPKTKAKYRCRYTFNRDADMFPGLPSQVAIGNSSPVLLLWTKTGFSFQLKEIEEKELV